MNGINPKIDWHAGDGITAGDLNYIGNQFWEQVYGCFDLQGIIRPPLDPEVGGVAGSVWLQMPPHTKLILTHANWVYLVNPPASTAPSNPRVSVVFGTTVSIPTNNSVWDIDTAPLVYLNDTPAVTNIVVQLEVGALGTHAAYAMFARVVVVPNA
jgi:hypothetical protein